MTLTGTAKGNVRLGLYNVTVQVGTSGTLSVSTTSTYKIGHTVNLPHQCDLQMRLARMLVDVVTTWRSITRTTYDTGFVEECVTGHGTGTGQEDTFVVETLPQNCNP